MTLTKRVAAAQATLDEFKGRPFKMGERDCVRMVASHLRRMGYKLRLPPAGSYRTMKTAEKKLRERGFKTLAEAVDSLGFRRIPPASALVGDIIEMPGEGIGALAVCLSNGRIVGYHQDAVGAVTLEPLEFVTAWRVEPA